jgi:hypothetical protein
LSLADVLRPSGVIVVPSFSSSLLFLAVFVGVAVDDDDDDDVACTEKLENINTAINPNNDILKKRPGNRENTHTDKNSESVLPI